MEVGNDDGVTENVGTADGAENGVTENGEHWMEDIRGRWLDKSVKVCEKSITRAGSRGVSE